jgi:hypothetical protein
VRIWDAATLEELARFEGHRDMILSVGFSLDTTVMSSRDIRCSRRAWACSVCKKGKLSH